MRLSVEDGDPGQCRLAHIGPVKVFLGGEQVQTAITADEELGYVKYFLYGFGRPVSYEVNGECRHLKLEKWGDVRIEVGNEVL